jgi:hypothetical protein
MVVLLDLSQYMMCSSPEMRDIYIASVHDAQFYQLSFPASFTIFDHFGQNQKERTVMLLIYCERFSPLNTVMFFLTLFK